MKKFPGQVNLAGHPEALQALAEIKTYDPSLKKRTVAIVRALIDLRDNLRKKHGFVERRSRPRGNLQ